ncbi:MAG TPA: bifunctional diaminohydroxyphosphoribosylaminopyrimidine deaminase/5-amino-6-(5-phosphoribosylamino)uracil reductase RibD [Longimicrobiales bacterium]
MLRALQLAERGWGQVHPNPMVGSVVVKDGVVVGEGWHQQYGGPHAEVNALRAAGEHAAGATLFVTLEPCSHHGKTPPCTDAIIAAGVTRVVFAAEDPDPAARGGADVLREHGIEVESGVERTVARRLNAAFHYSHEHGKPFVALKLALSLDGRISATADAPTRLTGDTATAEVHRLRSGFDAVMIGIGTALADDPLLTVRAAPAGRIPPARIVLDSGLRLPVGSRLAQSAAEAPLILIAGDDAPAANAVALESAGAEIIRVTTRADRSALDPAVILDVLGRRGIGTVLCEGGGRLAGSLMAEGAVRRLILFYAPVVLGEAAVAGFAGYHGRLDPPAWAQVSASMFGRDACVILDRADGA